MNVLYTIRNYSAKKDNDFVVDLILVHECRKSLSAYKFTPFPMFMLHQQMHGKVQFYQIDHERAILFSIILNKFGTWKFICRKIEFYMYKFFWER